MHIRLSHTHNNVPGRADYTGETDPRRVALALDGELFPVSRINPDIGANPFGVAPLTVGVDDRRSFPNTPWFVGVGR